MIRLSGERKKKSQCTEEVDRAGYFPSAAITAEDISSRQELGEKLLAAAGNGVPQCVQCQ